MPDAGEGEASHPPRTDDLLCIGATDDMSVGSARGGSRHDVGLHPESGGGRSPVLLVAHEQVLDLGLLEDDGQLVVVEEVNHRMLKNHQK